MTTYRFQSDAGVQPREAGRFAGLAYGGGIVESGVGLAGPSIIDLSRLQANPPIPVLAQHADAARVGVVEDIENNGRQLRVSGRFLQGGVAASVERDLRQQFPFQLSISFDGRGERLREGESRVVNGRTVEAPTVVIGPAVVREVSFVAVGADIDATVGALSREPAAILGRGRDLGRGLSRPSSGPVTLDALAVQLGADAQRLRTLKEAGVFSPSGATERGEPTFDEVEVRDRIRRHDHGLRCALGSSAPRTLAPGPALTKT